MASYIKTDDTNEEEEFLKSDKCQSVINLLTKFQIKLWELPNLDDPKSLDQVEELLMKLSDESGLVENELKNILILLQSHSKRKLDENKRFNCEGVAIFKLKIIGNNNGKRPRSFNENIELSVKITGSELKALIMSKFELDCSNLKIIFNGKVIREESLLSSQEIKNHSTLLIMCVYDSVVEKINQDAKDTKLISDIKDAVSILTEQRNFDSNMFKDIKLQNQNGVSIDVSKQDEICLTTAMILHEKAKNQMKSKEYIKALILLAEADNQFRNIGDKLLLERVDNYALLNLDIIWCYLNLENLHELKNAEERLTTCEKCLQKCYGADLERLTMIKNDSANKHTSIFVRVNLLKAILNYHKGKKRECKQFLDKAKSELQKITIDESKLIQVMSMGFSNIEAKLALRASFNDVDKAVEHIFKKKQTEKESKKLEKEIRLAKKLENTYGRTMNDKPIDVKVLGDLIQFGYTESRSARALVRSNNDFNLALDILQSDDISDILPEDNSSAKNSKNKLENFLDDERLSQLCSMGYDLETCKLCLQAFDNNIQKTVNFFVENKNIIFDSSKIKEKLEEIISNKEKYGQTSEGTTASSSITDEIVNKIEKTRNAQMLINDLAQEMPEDDEAYLDLNTEEDFFFINKYFSLLEF